MLCVLSKFLFCSLWRKIHCTHIYKQYESRCSIVWSPRKGHSLFQQDLFQRKNKLFWKRKRAASVCQNAGEFSQVFTRESFLIKTGLCCTTMVADIQESRRAVGEINRMLRRIQCQNTTRHWQLHGNTDKPVLKTVHPDNCCKQKEKHNMGECISPCQQPSHGTLWQMTGQKIFTKSNWIMRILDQFWEEKRRTDVQNRKILNYSSEMFKSCWTKWETLVIENWLLKGAWGSTDGSVVIMYLIVSRKRVSSILSVKHDGTSGIV